MSMKLHHSLSENGRKPITRSLYIYLMLHNEVNRKRTLCIRSAYYFVTRIRLTLWVDFMPYISLAFPEGWANTLLENFHVDICYHNCTIVQTKLYHINLKTEQIAISARQKYQLHSCLRLTIWAPLPDKISNESHAKEVVGRTYLTQRKFQLKNETNYPRLP